MQHLAWVSFTFCHSLYPSADEQIIRSVRPKMKLFRCDPFISITIQISASVCYQNFAHKKHNIEKEARVLLNCVFVQLKIEFEVNVGTMASCKRECVCTDAMYIYKQVRSGNMMASVLHTCLNDTAFTSFAGVPFSTLFSILLIVFVYFGEERAIHLFFGGFSFSTVTTQTRCFSTVKCNLNVHILGAKFWLNCRTHCMLFPVTSRRKTKTKINTQRCAY